MRLKRGKVKRTSRGLEEDFSSNRPGPSYFSGMNLMERGLRNPDRRKETIRILERFDLKVRSF